MRTFLTVLAGGIASIALLVILRLTGILPLADQSYLSLITATASAPFQTLISPDGSLILAAFFSFLFAFIAVEIPGQQQRWLVGIPSVFLVLTGSLVLALYEVLFLPAAPMAGIILGLVSTSCITRVGPAAFRRTIQEVFSASLGRTSLRALYEAPAASIFPVSERQVSVLCMETANHAHLMEVMEPKDFAEMCHSYLSFSAEFLMEAGGYLDSLSGQEARAVFGAPIGSEQAAEVACRTALDLSRRLERMHLEADSRWHHILEFHIGISTGTAVGGVFTSPRGKSFVIAGSPFDLAARLAFACRVYGCRILTCLETNRIAGEQFEVRPMDLIRHDGQGDIEIYELLCQKGSLSPERKTSRDHFWTGVGHVRANRWDHAVEEFSKARIKGIPDHPLDYYLHRIERERQNRPANSGDLPTI